MLISVDPAVDKPPMLAGYEKQAGFPLRSLTGSDQEIAGVTREYGVAIRKEPLVSGEGYIEVLFGPQETVGPLDAERMAREGIIKQSADGWAAFSENFSQYLLLFEVTRTSDNWLLWHQTETGLRATLTSALEQAYGKTWRTTLADSQFRLIRECEKRQERDRAFGEVIDDDSLLDYTHPRELLKIMMLHWEQVKPVFGHEKQDWNQRIELIAKVRNPMAHNRQAGTSPALMEQFRTACREILAWLPAGQPV